MTGRPDYGSLHPMTLPILTLCLLLLFGAGVWTGWYGRGTYVTATSAIRDTSPRIVVNVPADYKALEPIMVDGKPALVGPRALLFYSVYAKAIQGFTIDGTYSLDESEENEACQSAKAAVQQVYGDILDT